MNRSAPFALTLLCLAASGAWAQSAPATPPVAPASVQPAAPATAGEVQKVEITGGKASEVEERRRSTAAKIIVGRDEIEKYGDSSVGELLKRLPGVTIQGAPGRGGAIRMRGLGSGYTQILLDGERVQGGLSLDTLDPDQVERIEIIRAPTAETGARAIGGTINIITREGFTRRLNDLRLGLGFENGRYQPSASWSRDDKLGELDYNVALSAYRNERADASTVRTVNATEDRTETPSSVGRSRGVHLTGRLQSRGTGGDALMLMPLFIHSQGDNQRRSEFEPGSVGTLPFVRSENDNDWGFTLARLNGQWRAALGEGRMELRGGLGEARNRSHTLRTEFGSDQGGDLHYDDASRSTERTLNLNGKYSLLMENGHSLVTGAELDQARREEARDQLVNGQASSADFGENLQARSLRSALYAQDEWTVNPNWSAHAGLRWEGITTRGEGQDSPSRSNRSSVWTPLLHAVWKPEPKSQDQVRISLTRSYRSPTLNNLVGGTWRAKGNNSETNPDRSGNPDLQPELATGVDLAMERYLSAGGMLSVNLFQRQIQDLMRTVTSAETQADGSVRYVARPQNIGKAMTRGLELEAKFRLSALWPEAPALDLRANASLFQSRVEAVPGPDNRLDQQPSGTANLGADYKLPGLPVTVGGGFNWTPGYQTRLSATQSVIQARKRVIDAYAMWQLNSTMRLRLSGSNLAPEDYETSNVTGSETATTVAQGQVNWRLQLEMKL